MKREGVMNLVAALVSAALLAYVLSLTARAWSEFGATGTIAVLAAAAFVFASVFAVYTGLAFVFLMRAVSVVRVVPGGMVLHPDTHSHFSPVMAISMRRIRTYGPFVLFTAASRVWVAPSATFSDLEAARDV